LWVQSHSKLLSTKKSRNVIKKQRRAHNQLQKLAEEALSSGTVVNLSEKQLPPEVISLLSKRIGFVPTTAPDTLEMRTDCYNTMAKLTGATRGRLRDLQNNIEDDEKEDIPPIIPPSLKRRRVSVPYDSGDKVVDKLKDDVMAEIDLLKPISNRSNLSKMERQGLNWILKEINCGSLRVVQADKGGALCIVPKSFIKALEEKKLNDPVRYENIGESDPTPKAHEKLLNFWRFGENNSYVSRDECYDVVGLCEKKNGKQQRPSTSSCFKPRTPYFYGLLKIHKLDPLNLKPGVDIPIKG
jgi:hypothetical protein